MLISLAGLRNTVVANALVSGSMLAPVTAATGPEVGDTRPGNFCCIPLAVLVGVSRGDSCDATLIV